MGMIAHPAEDSRMPSKTPHTKTLRLKTNPSSLRSLYLAKTRRGANEAAGDGQNKERLSQPRIRGDVVAAQSQTTTHPIIN
jgi:hypothetical protein